jgi:hypothetical protein
MITEADIALNHALFGSDAEDDENQDAEHIGTFEEQQVGDAEQDAGQAGERGDEEDAEPEAVPEEEDHIIEEGLIYAQPRAPFAGTVWDGLLNAPPPE